MVKKDINTEKQILNAAKKVFERKGMYGSRMQEIADEAQINKALLHYYFRTKEKLFDAVFIGEFASFFPNLIMLFQSDGDIAQKLEAIVEHYVNLISSNPYLPIFIITEVNRDPGRMAQLMTSSGMNPKLIVERMNTLRAEGHLPDIDPRHIIMNLVSMSVFPYLSRPMMQPLLFNNDKSAFENFLKERKQIIINTILNR